MGWKTKDTSNIRVNRVLSLGLCLGFPSSNARDFCLGWLLFEFLARTSRVWGRSHSASRKKGSIASQFIRKAPFYHFRQVWASMGWLEVGPVPQKHRPEKIYFSTWSNKAPLKSQLDHSQIIHQISPDTHSFLHDRKFLLDIPGLGFVFEYSIFGPTLKTVV